MKKKFIKRILFVTTMSLALLFVACTKDIRDDIKSLDRRVTILEEFVSKLKQQIEAGAMIKSVTPLANNAGWRIEFTGGTTPYIDIFNGLDGIAAAAPRIEIRRNGDGTVSLWIDTGTGLRDTGINIKGDTGSSGSTGATGPAGIAPAIRVVTGTLPGTFTIEYNVTSGYPPGNWLPTGVDIPASTCPVIAIVENLAESTVTFTVDDGAGGTIDYEFEKATTAVRLELAMVAEKLFVAPGGIGKLVFRVNPSDGYVPAADLSKWTLEELGTRAVGYGATSSANFELLSIDPVTGKDGQYIATIEDKGALIAKTYVMALVLDVAAGASITSPTFPVCVQDGEARIGSIIYTTLADALAAAVDYDEIVLLKNVVINYDILLDPYGFTSSGSVGLTYLNDLTINLNGFNLDQTGSTETQGILVYDAVLNITDGTGGGVFDVYGTDFGIYADYGAIININGAIVNAEGAVAGIYAKDSDITLTAGGVLNAKGGSTGSTGIYADNSNVQATNIEGIEYGVYAENSSLVTVYGNVESTGTLTGHGVYAEFSSTVNVVGDVKGWQAIWANNSNVTANSAEGIGVASYGVWAEASGTIDITGDVKGDFFGVTCGPGSSVTVGGNVESNNGGVLASGVGSVVVIDGTVITPAGRTTAYGVSVDNGADVTVKCLYAATEFDKKIFTDGIYINLNSVAYAIDEFTSHDGGATYLFYEDAVVNRVKVAAPASTTYTWLPY